MELYEDMERLKLKFIAAYRRLCEAGQVSEAQFEEVLEIIDHLDEYPLAEVRKRLAKMWPECSGIKDS